MTAALAIRDLKKTYRNGHVALKGINLEVAEGDFFALLGPNGAGKSTTIGIVASLVNKSAGEVSIFGHDLETDLAAAKSCLGLVPQEFNFNQFEPVGEIVTNQAGYYGIERREALARSENYLRRLGLWEKRRGMARELSGGMKRRLMIARALVHEPRIVFLDEPFTGLDPHGARTLRKTLERLRETKRTVFMVTHNLTQGLELSDRWIILARGRVVDQGRSADTDAGMFEREYFDRLEAVKSKRARR